jgi:hypothetical protein
MRCDQLRRGVITTNRRVCKTAKWLDPPKACADGFAIAVTHAIGQNVGFHKRLSGLTMTDGKKTGPLLPVIIVVLSSLGAYLLVEGAVSVFRGPTPETSLGYRTYELIRGTAWEQGISAPNDPNATLLRDQAELEALVEAFRKNRVGLGNTVYGELKTGEASIHMQVDGCKRQKPNLRKLQTHLFTNLFDPLDPIVAFWDADRVLDPEVAEFIERYHFRKVLLTTNEFGDRVTFPEADSERKVIVGGDSMANGVLLNDDETLASQLQARDPARQYINTGINGISPREVICAIERAVDTYDGNVEELIYLYSENDFESGEPLGTPEEVVAWMEGFAREQDLIKVTVVYAPYFYNIMPQLTRFRGYRGHFFPHHSDERRRLAELVAEAGFRYIDITDVAREENERAGTLFAAFALFVDATHYSRYGTSRLVEHITASGS